MRVEYHIEALKLGKLEGTSKVRIGAVIHEADLIEQEDATEKEDSAEQDTEAEGGIKESDSA